MYQGYSDAEITPDLRVARFIGNPHTKLDEIRLMSMFRAMELCRQEKFRLADIYDNRIPNHGGEVTSAFHPYVDTQETTVGYGMIPVDTYFACRNESYLLGISLTPVPAAEVALFEKDGKGAVRVGEFVMFSPNKEKLKTDDLILELDGKRVTNMADIKTALAHAKDKSHIPAKVISDKHITEVELKAADATIDVSKYQDAIVKAVCANYPGTSDRPVCGAKTAK